MSELSSSSSLEEIVIGERFDSLFQTATPCQYFRSLLADEGWKISQEFTNETPTFALMDGGSVYIPPKIECWNAVIENYARDVALGDNCNKLYISEIASTYYRLFFELDGDEEEMWEEEEQMEIAQIAQEALEKFKIRSEDNDHYLWISSKFHGMIPENKAKLHLVWPTVIVNTSIAMYIWEYFCFLLEKKKPRPSHWKRNHWKKVVDETAIKNPKKVNIRLNFSFKTQKCDKCPAPAKLKKSITTKQQHQQQQQQMDIQSVKNFKSSCTYNDCNKNGKREVKGTYQLRWIINSKGNLMTDIMEKTVLNYKDSKIKLGYNFHEPTRIANCIYQQKIIAEQIRQTHIRTLEHHVSPFLKIPYTAAPPRPLFSIDQKITKNAKYMNFLNSEFELDKPIVQFSKDLQEQKKVMFRDAIILDLSSPEALGIIKFLSSSSKVLQVWQECAVTRIKLLFHPSINKKEYYVYVEGPGSSHCLNRIKNSDGRRSHTSNSIYFVIRAEGLVQKCWSTKRDPNTRLNKNSWCCSDFETRQPIILPLEINRILFNDKMKHDIGTSQMTEGFVSIDSNPIKSKSTSKKYRINKKVDLESKSDTVMTTNCSSSNSFSDSSSFLAPITEETSNNDEDININSNNNTTKNTQVRKKKENQKKNQQNNNKEEGEEDIVIQVKPKTIISHTTPYSDITTMANIVTNNFNNKPLSLSSLSLTSKNTSNENSIQNLPKIENKTNSVITISKEQKQIEQQQQREKETQISGTKIKKNWKISSSNIHSNLIKKKPNSVSLSLKVPLNPFTQCVTSYLGNFSYKEKQERNKVEEEQKSKKRKR